MEAGTTNATYHDTMLRTPL